MPQAAFKDFRERLSPEEHERIFGYRREEEPVIRKDPIPTHPPEDPIGSERGEAVSLAPQECIKFLLGAAKVACGEDPPCAYSELIFRIPRFARVRERLLAVGITAHGTVAKRDRVRFLKKRLRWQGTDGDQPVAIWVRRWRFIPGVSRVVVVARIHDGGYAIAFLRQQKGAAPVIARMEWDESYLLSVWRGKAVWIEP